MKVLPAFLLTVFFLTGSWASAGPGAELFQKGRTEDARRLFEEARKKNPSDREALLYLGRLARTGAESESFFQALTAGGEADSFSAEAFFRLGQIRYAAGLYTEAATCFRRPAGQADASRFRSESSCWLGLALLAQGKDDSAFAELSGLTEQDPASFLSAQIGLAQIYEKRKEWKKEMICLEGALDFGDNTLRSAAYFLLARLLKEAGDKRGANTYGMKLTAEFPFSLEAAALKKEYGGAFPDLSPETQEGGKPAGPEGEGYVIQVGAFSIRENAERVRDKLKMELPVVDVVSIKKGKSTLYAVWIGAFENDLNARAFARDTLKMAPGAYHVKKKSTE